MNTTNTFWVDLDFRSKPVSVVFYDEEDNELTRYDAVEYVKFNNDLIILSLVGGGNTVEKFNFQRFDVVVLPE